MYSSINAAAHLLRQRKKTTFVSPNRISVQVCDEKITEKQRRVLCHAKIVYCTLYSNCTLLLCCGGDREITSRATRIELLTSFIAEKAMVRYLRCLRSIAQVKLWGEQKPDASAIGDHCAYASWCVCFTWDGRGTKNLPQHTNVAHDCRDKHSRHRNGTLNIWYTLVWAIIAFARQDFRCHVNDEHCLALYVISVVFCSVHQPYKRI